MNIHVLNISLMISFYYLQRINYIAILQFNQSFPIFAIIAGVIFEMQL